MSVQAISWVLDYSEARLADRLVLLAIANHAKADGTGAWPGVPQLAREAKVSERAAREALRNLEQMGELRTTPRAGPHHTNLYDLPLMGGADSAGVGKPRGAGSDRKRGRIASTTPISEPSLTVKQKASLSTDLPTDVDSREMWDVFVEETGHAPATKSERGKWNRGIGELRRVEGISLDLLRRVVRTAAKTWRIGYVNPASVASNFSELVSKAIRPIDRVLAEIEGRSK